MKMTKKEKRGMARWLADELKAQMLLAIDKAPAEWDGIELRQLFVDLAVTVSEPRRYALTQTRRRAYESDLIDLNI